jgi:hypothetical protein
MGPLDGNILSNPKDPSSPTWYGYFFVFVFAQSFFYKIEGHNPLIFKFVYFPLFVCQFFFTNSKGPSTPILYRFFFSFFSLVFY